MRPALGLAGLVRLRLLTLHPTTLWKRYGRARGSSELIQSNTPAAPLEQEAGAPNLPRDTQRLIPQQLPRPALLASSQGTFHGIASALRLSEKRLQGTCFLLPALSKPSPHLLGGPSLELRLSHSGPTTCLSLLLILITGLDSSSLSLTLLTAWVTGGGMFFLARY